MRTSSFLVISGVLTILVVFILYVPVLENQQTGNWIECTGYGQCFEHVMQFESISYAYAGYGAFFQTGVNWYAVMRVGCYGYNFRDYNCPIFAMDCCGFPLASVVWSVVGSLALIDFVSILIIMKRVRSRKSKKTM